MKNFTILIFLFTLFVQADLNGQDCTTIVKNIDLEGEETVWNSAINKEGNIYICGTLSRPASQNAAFLVKTDTVGNVLWSRVIAGTGKQIFRKAYPTNDSGVITSGISSTYPANPNFAATVIKWDKHGNRQWSRSFNSNSVHGDWGLGVMQASDGGFLITGNLNSSGYQSSAYLLKVSVQGVFEWAKRYAYAEGVEFQGAIEGSDSYIIAGEYLYNSNTSYRPLIIRVNKSNGNVQEIKSFTLPGNIAANGELKVRPDGGYFFNGYDLTYAPGFNGDFRQVVIYLNASLNVEKAVRISHETLKNQNLVNLIPLVDGGFISSSGGSKDSDDAHFYRVNKDGQIVWKRKMGGLGGQQLTSSSLLADSSVIFVGSTNKGSATLKDILWLRVKIGYSSGSCGLENSDAVSEIISISNLVFSFQSITELPTNLWVTINPAIQEDVHSVTYNCQPECREPTCGVVVKNFDIGGEERVWSTSTSPDNYVYLAGGTVRTGGEQASFVLKTDSAGTPIWSRAIPGNGNQFFRKVLATKDSGAIAVGLSSTYPSSVSGSAIVVKWDKNGVRKWSKSYRTNSPNYDNALNVLETDDGGILLVGTHNSAGYTAQGFVLKLDINGDVQWIKHYPYPEGVDLVSAVESEDGFLVSGNYLYNANKSYGLFIIRLRKSDGVILQTKSWKMPNDSILYYGTLHKVNSGYYLTGTQLLEPLPNYFNKMRQIVMHLDNSLNLVSTTGFSHIIAKNGLVANIKPMADDSYIGAAGGENESDDVDIYKVSAAGEILWKTRLGGIGGQNIWSISPMEDSSFVFAGTSYSTGKKDILWLKLPIGKSIEGCEIQESDASTYMVSLDEASFSFSQIITGNVANWVLINPAIESDNFTTTYSCGSICKPENPLPLRFISLNGHRNLMNTVNLRFVTANEVNVDALIVERSYVSNDFSEIGTVVPKGKSFNEYEFIDNDLNKSFKSVLYRVKAIARDGKLSFSKIISMNFINEDSRGMKLYPNPSDGNFQIQYLSETEQKNSTIAIINMEGKQISQYRINISRGLNVINITQGRSLPKGLYYIRLYGINDFSSKKLLIK